MLLYSDLPLPDIGASVDDQIAHGNASGADWRAAPLTGLRLRDHLLHDGRAAIPRNAVLDQGGEGDRVRFFALDEPKQEVVCLFMVGVR